MATVVIPDYIRKVKLSKARRNIYYVFNGVSIIGENGKALPSKYYETDCGPEDGSIPTLYSLKKDYKIAPIKRGKKYLQILVHKDSGEPVLVNPKAAGTPKLLTINGQDLYSGNVAKFARAKMMAAIKESYVEHVKRKYTELKEFFTVAQGNQYVLEIELYDNKQSENWDLPNRLFPYEKAFLDLLVTGRTDSETKVFEPLLKDDSIKYISAYRSRFFHTDDEPYILFTFKIIAQYEGVSKNF